MSVDGRDLMFTFSGGPEFVADNPCSDDYRADLQETLSEVRAAIWTRSGAATDDDFMCTGEAYLRSVTVPLADRLGDRTVILEPGGAEIAVSDKSTIATAGWLPDGWTQEPPAPFRNSAWEHFFSAPGSSRGCSEDDDAYFVLYQGPRGLLDTFEPPDGATISTHDVHGVVAEYRLGGAGPEAELRWTENGQDLRITTVAPCDDTDPVALSVMLRFARRLSIPPH